MIAASMCLGRVGWLSTRVLPVLRVAVLLLAMAAPAAAHPLPFSYIELYPEPGRLRATIVVHLLDIAHDLNEAVPHRLLDSAIASSMAESVTSMLAPRVSILVNGVELHPDWSGPTVLVDRQMWRFTVTFPMTGRPGTIVVRARMFPYDPKHQTFINIYDGPSMTQAMLDASRMEFEYFPGTREGVSAAVRRFLPAGIHHILIGPDHLMFLVGLLLAGGTLWSISKIVTAFTVAHSVTLSIAATGLIIPPPLIVEPAIALSIVYVGANNLTRGAHRDSRVGIAAAFGLIHGFGFANVLRQMDLPARALGWSLFSFNLGVEIGQVSVVLVVAGGMWLLHRSGTVTDRRLAVAGSYVVIAAGVIWFVQRALFPEIR